MTNPIEEYFRDESNKLTKFSELFKGNDDFIDQMSEVSDQQIVLMLSLHETDRYLSSLGIQPVFASYMHKFLRLQVSKDRKSRGEYVEVNKPDKRELDGKEVQLTGRLT